MNWLRRDGSPPAAGREETAAGRSDRQEQLAGVLRLAEDEVAAPAADLERARELMAGAVAQLAASFARIDELAREQQRQTLSLLSDVSADTARPGHGTVTVSQLSSHVAETSRLLGQFVTLVVNLSKRSMDIFYRVEEATARLDAAQRLVEDVRWIAHKTSLVAINATIESARLGEAGAGFAVVAGEVRSLAQRARQVSEGIEREITASVESAQQARVATQENAAQDLTVLLTSRTWIDGLARGVQGLEQAIGDKLATVGSLTEEVARETGAACRSLQFEDIARQILERSGQDLNGLRDVLASVRHAIEQPGEPDDLVALAARLRAEHLERAQHKPGQQTIAAGEVELF